MPHSPLAVWIIPACNTSATNLHSASDFVCHLDEITKTLCFSSSICTIRAAVLASPFTYAIPKIILPVLDFIFIAFLMLRITSYQNVSNYLFELILKTHKHADNLRDFSIIICCKRTVILGTCIRTLLSHSYPRNLNLA